MIVVNQKELLITVADWSKIDIVFIITGPPNGTRCCQSACVVVVCRCYLSSVTLPAYLPAGRRACGNAAWERFPAVRLAGRMGGQAADTARRASTVTSR